MGRKTVAMKFFLAVGVFACHVVVLAQGLDLGATSYAPNFVANLASQCNETSGLVFSNDTIFSINDSGNQPKVQALSAVNGQLLAEWSLTNAVNIDWEAVALSPQQMFLGDIGNNMGNRSIYELYRFERNQLSVMNTTINFQKLVFKFADQPAGAFPANAHNYDAEAMFFWQDSLHILSKNWQNLWTRHYVLPTNWQDTLVVEPRDSFYVNGLVTDAVFDGSSNQVLMLGYKKESTGLYSSFMYRLLGVDQGLFAGNFQRVELGSTLTLAQTEGICVSGPQAGFISGEQIVSVVTIAPKLHAFDLTDLVQIADKEPLDIYFNGTILYIPQQFLPTFQLIDTSGRVAINWTQNKNHQDLSKLLPGTYFLIGPNFRRTWVKTN